MANETDPQGGALAPVQQQQQQTQTVRLEINQQGMETSYANFFRVAGTFEELLLDFGFHTGLMIGNTPEPAKVTNRIIMSFATAKRLLGALQAAVQRHEQMFGVVETDPQKRIRRPATTS
ncbi:MAG: DUF3467 domain-containing protein [Gemmataceae bacterium]|nr:DUF3467 domain-containing protein [Gemmataceae bacterium]